MINELHDVNISLNQKIKDKQERENKKTLINQYNEEIKGDLLQLFYKLFSNYDIMTAYKKAILEKEQNIEILTNLIESITPEKEG